MVSSQPQSWRELENGAWREEWEERQVDPFDRYSLYALFSRLELADEEAPESNIHYPQCYIVDEFEPQPVVQIPDEPHIVVLSSEDLWGKADLVTVWVDGEELPVNKAMVDEGLIKSDNFWDSLEEENLWDILEMELLNETLEKTRLDNGKRKADTDLLNLWDDLPVFQAKPSPKTISNLTRSGRIYQPSNFRRGVHLEHSQLKMIQPAPPYQPPRTNPPTQITFSHPFPKITFQAPLARIPPPIQKLPNI